MSDGPRNPPPIVDLDNCADEPIHIPGSIQPHGALLAISLDDQVVRIVSANAADWFGADPAELIGRPIAEVVDHDTAAWATLLCATPQDRAGIAITDPTDRDVDVTAHRSGNYLVIELEPRGSIDPEVAQFSRRATLALQANTEIEVAERAAQIIRMLTGFDRVMVYRFDHEWNGEVIAERCRRDLNRFLGLHYPATDIPAQARALYEQNWIRTIVDIGYQPVPLMPAVSFADAEPFDLSGSVLRSVSPMHVEYLSNMGVTASMSVSLIVNGRLWGLIACHHYSGPLHPSAAVRTAAEFLGQVASTVLSQHIAIAAHRLDEHLTAIVDQISESLNVSPLSVRETFQQHGQQVLEVCSATSAAIAVGDELWTIGNAPGRDVIEAIRKHAQPSSMPWYTDRLAQTIGHIDTEEQGRYAGALACQLSPGWEDLIVWFREEQVLQVDWGGDPQNAKIYADDGDRVRLSPRKSFDRWREVVRGTSREWDQPVVRNAGRCAFKLAGALLREERASRALTEQLQRMIRPSAGGQFEGYELSMWYQPADNGQVGGDWFDVIDLNNGDLALIVGDTAGHGVHAAAQMTQLRYMLRAYLLIESSPAAALTMLDRAITATMPGTFATCIVAVIEAGSGRVVVSHAGHVPALMVRSGAGGQLVQTDGDPLLGIGAASRHQTILDLEPEDLLVLYSDGLVERRAQLLDVALERLVELAGTITPQMSIDEVTESLLGVHDGEREDAVCVLAVRRRL